MNYKVYYVIIAWEWFLCVFSVCFWDGCKWIKKGGLCARGWENREPFFIDLLWGKQVLKTHKIPLMRWGALDWVGETTSAKRSYLKKITRKPIVNL
jgi:hypothetical protein